MLLADFFTSATACWSSEQPVTGPGPAAAARPRGLTTGIIILAAILTLMLLGLSLLQACQPVNIPSQVPANLPSQPFEPFTPP